MFKVVVGCYEQIVIGYNVTINKSSSNKEFTLLNERQFSDHSHMGCVRCVASNDVLVVSGSSDEFLSLFNMKTNTDLGPLQGHSGSVNEIAIPESLGSRILSCGDDGNICVFEAGQEKGLIRTLRGHKGAVTSISVHPSGKLAMTASIQDGTLRTWNLITGRSAYVKNMKQAQIEFVRFSPNGDYYITASSRFIQVYELTKAKCVEEWETPQHVLTIKFLPLIHSTNEQFIAVGDGSGFISVHSIPSGRLIIRYKAHENRVKDVYGFIPDVVKESNPDEVWLATVSSDEMIKIWRFDSELLSGNLKDPSAKCLLSINTTARLTCVTVWQGSGSSDENEAEQTLKSAEYFPHSEGGLRPHINEQVEITYDEPLDEMIGNGLPKPVDRKKATTNERRKKVKLSSRETRRAKMEMLRADLKTFAEEENDRRPESNIRPKADESKSLTNKKKIKKQKERGKTDVANLSMKKKMKSAEEVNVQSDVKKHKVAEKSLTNKKKIKNQKEHGKADAANLTTKKKLDSDESSKENVKQVKKSKRKSTTQGKSELLENQETRGRKRQRTT